MKVKYTLKYVKNIDTDRKIKEAFKNKIAVIGNKNFDRYVFNGKGDIWIKGFYKGLGFGKKIAKLVGIINSILCNRDFKVKEVELFGFSGQPPTTALSVSVVEDDNVEVPKLEFGNEILRGCCEFEHIRFIDREKINEEIKNCESCIVIGKLNSKMYRYYLLRKLFDYNYCKIYAFGRYVEKIPLVLMMKKFPIKISKISFFDIKQDVEKFPIVSGMKVVIVRGDKNEIRL